MRVEVYLRTGTNLMIRYGCHGWLVDLLNVYKAKMDQIRKYGWGWTEKNITELGKLTQVYENDNYVEDDIEDLLAEVKLNILLES